MTRFNHDRYPEARTPLLAWISEGKRRNLEYMHHGIEHVGGAFCDLFGGRNVGKAVVRLVEEAEAC